MTEMKTRHIVVAASGRKAGKTLFAQTLIGVAAEIGIRCVYVKLRRSPEAVFSVRDEVGAEASDTSRCFLAGAKQVFLVEYRNPSELSGFRSEAPARGALVVWETNSAVDIVEPDALIYLEVKPGTGKNPGLASRASLVVPGPLPAPPSRELCAMALNVSGIPGCNSLSPEWKCWLSNSRGVVIGSGIAGLLHSIGETGSISRGAAAQKISYRRAWTLLAQAEVNLGARLIRRTRGGKHQGGSRLTLLAGKLLAEYRTLTNRIGVALKNTEDM